MPGCVIPKLWWNKKWIIFITIPFVVDGIWLKIMLSILNLVPVSYELGEENRYVVHYKRLEGEATSNSGSLDTARASIASGSSASDPEGGVNRPNHRRRKCEFRWAEKRIHTTDFTTLAPSVYFIRVSFENKKYVFKIVRV
jgi:hypothetical protein